jgi:hypothetical protein
VALSLKLTYIALILSETFLKAIDIGRCMFYEIFAVEHTGTSDYLNREET